MSTELPLSIKTRLVLNSSIISMMTNWSSCGCFTPLASSLKNTMSMVSLLLCFNGGVVWTLLTCLCCNFLRDLNEPPLSVPHWSSWSPLRRSLDNHVDFPHLLAYLMIVHIVQACTNLVHFSSQTFVIFPSRSAFLFVLLGPYSPLCSAHDLCENDNTFSCHGH